MYPPWFCEPRFSVISVCCYSPHYSPLEYLSHDTPIVCYQIFISLRAQVTWSLKKKRYFIYLFLNRGEGREKERETSIYGCLSYASYWGPGPQPRHVLRLGIEPATLWFTVQCSIHWATPARAWLALFNSAPSTWPGIQGAFKCLSKWINQRVFLRIHLYSWLLTMLFWTSGTVFKSRNQSINWGLLLISSELPSKNTIVYEV